jgi:WD40 repeat protein/predicted Ser/Thr protein kinase
MEGPERYARVKRLFLAAGSMPKGPRTRFLEAECGGDSALAADVRQLLTADEGSEEFLERPAVDAGSGGLAPGTRLGHFVVERVLGEGGMGMVYEALEEEAGRRVALKVIRPGFVTARLRSRFRHEIRVLGQLRHPGIAQIYEAGTVGAAGEQVPYFAMELVDGRPLLEVARGLGVRGRLALIAQVCEAVQHAHQKGVIHRDLKPGNILVEDSAATDTTGSGGTALPLRVKVLDFGIARAADPEAGTATVRTEAGQLVGTLPYMSPEQARGEWLDVRSDVYSIGVIAFEALSGRLPHAVRDRPLPEAARIIQEAEPTRLGSVDRALRGDIETIVARSLEKDPRKRYQSAADLGADIRRYLRDEPIVARPHSALYQMRKFARRHRALVASAALVLAAMSAATVVSIYQARVAVRAQHFAEGEQRRADRSAEVAGREAKRARLAGAAAAMNSGDPITARRLLGGADEGRRGWSLAHWRSRLDQSVAVVGRAGGPPLAGAWLSPDGGEVATVGRDGELRRGPPWYGELPRIASLERPVALAVFTADGARVIAACGESRRELGIFDAGSGRMVSAVAEMGWRAGLLAASEDGGVIAAGLRRLNRSPPANDLWLWRPGKEGWEERLVVRELSGTGIDLSRSGEWLAYGHSEMRVWDTRTVEVVQGGQPLTSLARGILCCAFNGDGTLMAVGGEDKKVRIVDRRTGAEVAALAGHVGDVVAVALDPAGRMVGSAGKDLTVRMWELLPGGKGAPVATFTGHSGLVQRLAFDGEGSRLMSMSEDGTVRLWQRDPQEGVSILRGHGLYVYGVAFSPDGERVYSGAWDRTVRAWSAAGGEPLAVMESPDQTGFVTALAASPDGRLVASGHKSEEWIPGPVRVWDAATGALVHEVVAGRGAACKVVFSADSRRLWVAWDHRGVAEIDLTAAPPQPRQVVQRGEVRSLAVSPDGGCVAVGYASGAIGIVDAASGEALATLEGHRGWVGDLAFHPGGSLLASASADGTVRLWDVGTRRCTAVLEGHWEKVYAAAFSPDGRDLATGSEDATIIIWDVASGEALTQLRGHEAYVYALAWSPDGSRLVSGSGDHTVRVWDTRPVHERWAARMAEAAR